MNPSGRLVTYYPQGEDNPIVLHEGHYRDGEMRPVSVHVDVAYAEKLHRELGEVLQMAKGRPCSSGAVCSGEGEAEVR